MSKTRKPPKEPKTCDNCSNCIYIWEESRESHHDYPILGCREYEKHLKSENGGDNRTKGEKA